MSRTIIWRDQPAVVFGLFDRRRRGRGCWTNEAIARAALATRPGGYLLVMHEYTAKLPDYGHVKRLVVDVVRGSAVA